MKEYFTDKTVKRLIEMAKKGYPDSTAEALAGLPSGTVKKWLQFADRELAYHQDPDDARRIPVVDFYFRYREARSQADVQAIEVVLKKVKKDPKTAQQWLESREESPDDLLQREIKMFELQSAKVRMLKSLGIDVQELAKTADPRLPIAQDITQLLELLHEEKRSAE